MSIDSSKPCDQQLSEHHSKKLFSSGIHPALLDTAKINGAGETQIYFKIVLPQSLPIIATLGLLVELGYWNN